MTSVYERDTYRGYLALVPLLSACSADELELVTQVATTRTVRAGEAVIEQGTEGDEFFVVADGSARVVRDGRELATVGRGDFFGELALFDPAPRNATVEAIEPLTLVVLARSDFTELLDRSPAVRASVFRGMARRIHELDERF